MSTRLTGVLVAMLGLGSPPVMAAEPPSNLSAAFNAELEFPNYFLKKEFQSLPPDQIESEVERSKQLITKALGSVFERMTVPVVPEGKTEAELVRYIDYVVRELHPIDPEARVMVSGGVVRSALSYLYDEIYAGMNLPTPVSPETTLRQIINSKADIPGFQIRGVGSDFDLLLQCAPEKFAPLRKRLLAITNSAENKYASSTLGADLRRSLFTVGDVKEYREQIQRSTNQGGATIDFLAYDVKAHRLVEPTTHPHIINDFIRGFYSYDPPAFAGAVEDEAKQVVRGVRALLELPFLKLQDEQQLRNELQALLLDIDNGKIPSPKAIEQFAKMVRNARYSGAHNRFYRSPEGSLESLFLKLSKKLSAHRASPLIPEYVDRHPLEPRTQRRAELRGLPESMLMSHENFWQNYTNNGSLYHGTPSTENGIAIMRGGLFLSKEGQGAARFGRGSYSSKDLALAQEYAGSQGLVLKLNFKKDHRLNILDWPKIKEDPIIKTLQRQAQQQGRDVFEYLAREHGIDIIVNHHVLIQNLEAVEVPRDLGTLAEAHLTMARNPRVSANQRFDLLNEYSGLADYAHALGIEVTPPRQAEHKLLPNLAADLAQLVQSSKPAPFDAQRAYENYAKVRAALGPELVPNLPSVPDLKRRLIEQMKKLLLDEPPSDELVAIAKVLKDADVPLPNLILHKWTARHPSLSSSEISYLEEQTRALYSNKHQLWEWIAPLQGSDSQLVETLASPANISRSEEGLNILESSLFRDQVRRYSELDSKIACTLAEAGRTSPQLLNALLHSSVVGLDQDRIALALSKFDPNDSAIYGKLLEIASQWSHEQGYDARALLAKVRGSKREQLIKSLLQEAQKRHPLNAKSQMLMLSLIPNPPAEVTATLGKYFDFLTEEDRNVDYKDHTRTRVEIAAFLKRNGDARPEVNRALHEFGQVNERDRYMRMLKAKVDSALANGADPCKKIIRGLLKASPATPRI